MSLTIFSQFHELFIQINLLIQLGFYPKLPKYPQPIKIPKLRTKLIEWSRKSLPRRNSPKREDGDDDANSKVLQTTNNSIDE